MPVRHETSATKNVAKSKTARTPKANSNGGKNDGDRAKAKSTSAMDETTDIKDLADLRKPVGQDYLNYKSQLVHNLSSYVLTPNEERLLQRGWKFCIENKVSNMMNFMTEIELNAYTLKPVISASVFKVFCRDFYLFSSQMMKVSKRKNIRNVSDAEYEAIQSLKSNTDIVVMKADKGNCIVILDKKDYVRRACEILQLDQFESVTRRAGLLHLHNREKQMNDYIRTHLHDKQLIGTSLFMRLHSTSASFSTFYGLPKIHKNNYPLRPIISSIGSYSYELSKHLANIINRHRPAQVLSHVKDSFHFVNLIKDFQFQSNQSMYSFDIESLYTQVPVFEAIDCALDLIFKDKKWQPTCPYSREQMKNLLKFAVCDAPFRFYNEIFIQREGVAMGSVLGPILAELFVQKEEEKIQNLTDIKPVLYKRY
ncbi:unnamed protein product, partial [Didymodactylos carnosus]